MVIHMTKEQLYTRGGVLDELMDTGFDAAGLVDGEGRLIRYSLPTLRDLGLTHEESVGRPIEELDPDTHLGRVARTGMPEAGRLTLMRGKYHIVTELPIYDGAERIGGMGMLVSLDTNKLKRALTKLSDGAAQGAALYDSLARASGSYTFNDYIGEHPLVKDLLDRCRQAASTHYPVLITGETGTGKEILAGAIHSTAFPNGSAPYVKINCTAIPDNLLESELFGHEKGAFTGAVTAKKGKFELAGGGSILLDEIGEMDLRMQSKLLRVLEEKEFERLGGSRMQVMNTRVMASTNADLHALAAEGRFRSDLYYRLSTIEISVPPLRERASDIPRLVEHFVQRENLQVRFSPEALDILSAYRWPGNVRQLRNVVLRLGIGAAGQTLGGKQITAALPREPEVPAAVPAKVESRPSAPRGTATMEEAERLAIEEALAACGHNQSKAAQRLGVGRTTLYRKMKKYGIPARRGLEFNDAL